MKTSKPAGGYSERLTVPWYWWIAGAVVASLLCYEVTLAARWGDWMIGAWVLIVAVIAVLLWSMGRGSVAIRDGELWAGNAHLPLELVSRAAAVPPEAKSAALGRQLDPAAFVYHRGWIKSMIVVVLDDPDDPTPYWMVSTRHPEKMLALIPAATTLG
ncbi:membrane protein [Tsukamurella pulmonis]|uniref:DUF3093 domain-containing protein n=1 Tax=Tsukamurella pulmonis TaxID=47312 RepID=A0A1H1EDQ0_9ACTN|nr:hypothetical protein AXK56_02455 [Tsukamurella pulmonis]KXP09635.1 hypothetical protein AXK57_12310 [Tsukamurella pulmonis]RDH09427.1 DUF3093 domain-containing protein [Tsukamurella pulmonis]SDQ86680.1 Protein of unknown function [Tsukamurella pulmonis]SUP21022.1 Protein of uncharacterised function (DUF3093) [Tsukamurella pulmonis]